MAIDIKTEQIYNLRTLRRLLPRPVSVHTLKRWIRVGVLSRKKKQVGATEKKRTKLDHIRHGGEICSSFEAYERFTKKLGE